MGFLGYAIFLSIFSGFVILLVGFFLGPILDLDLPEWAWKAILGVGFGLVFLPLLAGLLLNGILRIDL